MRYGDHRETRIFDFQRYELSKRLPAILETLAQRKCYHTGKGGRLESFLLRRRTEAS